MSAIGSLFADRCFNTTTTTGTGTLTLGGTQAGWRDIIATFGDGGVGTFCVTDEVDWEVFIGTVTASGNLLARTTVLGSSNGGSAVNWGAGTRNVFSDLPAKIMDGIVDPGFRPHAEVTPAMTVRVEAGKIFKPTNNGGGVTSVAAQSTGTITAPIANPRIDRVVVDHLTGVVSVITGTPAGSPSAPGISSGQIPIAQILLQTSSTVITDSMITDERVIPLAPIPGLQLLKTTVFSGASSVSFTNGMDGSFDSMTFVMSNLISSAANPSFGFRVSQDGGSTWKSGVTDYRWQRYLVRDAAAWSFGGSTGDTQAYPAVLYSGFPSDIDVKVSGLGIARPSVFQWSSRQRDTGAGIQRMEGDGMFQSNGNANNGVQFFPSAGTFSGSISLYGLRR